MRGTISLLPNRSRRLLTPVSFEAGVFFIRLRRELPVARARPRAVSWMNQPPIMIERHLHSQFARRRRHLLLQIVRK